MFSFSYYQLAMTRDKLLCAIKQIIVCSEVTSFSVAVAVWKQQRFIVDNLIFGVQLADILTRCSSHSQGKNEARCEMVLYRRGYCACVPMRLGAEVEALVPM